MVWDELKGTRKIETGLTHQDIVLTVQSTAVDTLPALGSTYNDITGNAELASVGLTANLEAVQILQVKRATPTKTHATVRFRGYQEE